MIQQILFLCLLWSIVCSETCCLPHYGEGWQWHSSFEIENESTQENESMQWQNKLPPDLRGIHAEMYHNEREISIGLDNEFPNVALLRFTIVFKTEDQMLNHKTFSITSLTNKEIGFLSGWGNKEPSLKLPCIEQPIQEDVRFFDIPPYFAALRHCYNYEEKANHLERRFNNKSLSTLSISDTDLYMTNTTKSKSAPKLVDLTDHARALHTSKQTTQLFSTNFQKQYEAVNDLFEKYSQGFNLPGVSKTLETFKAQYKQWFSDATKCFSEARKHYSALPGHCAESLALDILSDVLKEEQPIPNTFRTDIAIKLKKSLIDFCENKELVYFITHVHSTMDPCHVCAPTLWAETMLKSDANTKGGILYEIAQKLKKANTITNDGQPLKALTFISSAKKYKNRLYRQLNTKIDYPVGHHINLAKLNHMVQWRFATEFKNKTIVLTIKEAQKREAEEFAQSWVKEWTTDGCGNLTAAAKFISESQSIDKTILIKKIITNYENLWDRLIDSIKEFPSKTLIIISTSTMPVSGVAYQSPCYEIPFEEDCVSLRRKLRHYYLHIDGQAPEKFFSISKT